MSVQPLKMANLGVLGEVIRSEREKRGLSQEALGDLSRLSRTYIGEVERGEVSVSLATLESIANGLGMMLSEVVGEYERRTERAD